MDGMLVSKKWLDAANDKLFSNAVESSERRGSLFYDARPAVLATSWTANAAGLWQATAYFLVNDVVDQASSFPICAPTATANPGGTAGTTRFFVVWRGRWEAIPQGVTSKVIEDVFDSKTDEVSVVRAATLTGSALASVSPTTGSALATATLTGSALGAVSLQSSSTSSDGAIAYVSSIECNNEGELVVNFRYLTISTTDATQSITTTDASVVTGVTTSPASLSLNLTRVDVLKKS